MDQPPTPPAAEHDAPGRIPLCPVCGYDLRGTAGERCSECGLVIDHADLARSSIPWAYRREIGRARAFLRTVCLVTLDLKRLRHEAAKPQSAHDAAVFRRWIIVLVAPSLAALAVIAILWVGIDEIVAERYSRFGMPAGKHSGLAQDLLVPWSAGIGAPGALFAYVVLAAVAIAGGPGAVVRVGRESPEKSQAAARAMGRYAAAPLAWLAPATAAFAFAMSVGDEPSESVESASLYLIATATWIVLGLAAVGGTVLRTGQWRARVRHGGWGTGFLAMGELLVRWALTLGVVLFVVPWCIGLLWIVFDSFRR